MKAPGTKRLKLVLDQLLSIFAFNFNLRRYTELEDGAAEVPSAVVRDVVTSVLAPVMSPDAVISGRGLHSLTSNLALRTFGNTSLTWSSI
jgi:hypothetical protein